MTVSIDTLDKAELLSILYYYAKPVKTHLYIRKSWTIEEARMTIKGAIASKQLPDCSARSCEMDYIGGRVLKTNLLAKKLDLSSYKKENDHIDIDNIINDYISCVKDARAATTETIIYMGEEKVDLHYAHSKVDFAIKKQSCIFRIQEQPVQPEVATFACNVAKNKVMSELKKPDSEKDMKVVQEHYDAFERCEAYARDYDDHDIKKETLSLFGAKGAKLLLHLEMRDREKDQEIVLVYYNMLQKCAYSNYDDSATKNKLISYDLYPWEEGNVTKIAMLCNLFIHEEDYRSFAPIGLAGY